MTHDEQLLHNAEHAYRRSLRKGNYEKAYQYESRVKQLQRKLYGCTFTTEYRTNSDRERLVTIIIDPV